MKPRFPKKYKPQDISEEEGSSLLDYRLNKNFFLIVDFSRIVGKDRHPGIDGLIRLREGEESYLNSYLLFQLKSKKSLKNYKYSCDKYVVDFAVSSNVPCLLFVVDNTKEEVYWHIFDKEQIQNFKSNPSGITIDLSGKQVTKGNAASLFRIWEEYAERGSYVDSRSVLDEMDSGYGRDAAKVVALTYIFQVLAKETAVEIGSSITKLSKNKVSSIFEDLLKTDVLIDTSRVYLLKNEEIGIVSLHDHLCEWDLNEVISKAADEKESHRILSRFAIVEHPKVEKFLRQSALGVIKVIKDYPSAEKVSSALDTLLSFVNRTPKLGMRAVRSLLKDQSDEEKFKYRHADLREKTIEILGRLRYLNTKEVTKILLQLSLSKDERLSKKASGALKSVSEFNLNILKQVGYYAQKEILGLFEEWKVRNTKKYFYPILDILRQIVSPSFEGRSWSDYKTLTLQSGPLPVSDELKELRKRSIVHLQKMYDMASNLKDKMAVISVLSECTQPPHQGGGLDMEEMILSNTNDLIDWYLQILPQAGNEIIKEVEKNLGWLKRRFQKDKPKRLPELKAIIAQKTDYQVFRVLVGHDFQFDPELGWKEAQGLRKEKVQEFIDEMDEENYAQWRKILLEIAHGAAYDERGEYNYFRVLLFDLGKQKPTLALKLYVQEEERIEKFKAQLLGGMYESENKQAKELIKEKIKLGRDLDIIARIHEFSPTVDIQMFKNLANTAYKVNDLDALNCIIVVIIKRVLKYPILKDVVYKIIRKLTKHQDARWVYNSWFRWDDFVKTMSVQEAEIVLNNIIHIPNLDYKFKELIGCIAKQFPLELVRYFEKRVILQLKNNSFDFYYHAIPFRVHKLDEKFYAESKVVVPSIFKWFKKKNTIWRWYGSRMLSSLYSISDGFLQKELKKLIDSGSAKNIKVFLVILRAYKESPELLRLCEYLLEKVEKPEQYHSDLYVILSQTGVVSGEYGFAEAYERKSKSIESWKKHRNIAVRSFAKKYIEQMKQKAEAEKIRADERITLMERGVDD